MKNLNKMCYELVKTIIKYALVFKAKLFPNSMQKMLIKWYKDGGDFELRFNYPLNSDSIVFDVGGFVGDFASDLFSRMPCKIYTFEPVKKYHLAIQNRFKFNNMIKVFPFGLSNKTESTFIEIKGEGSSTFINDLDYTRGKKREKIKLMDVAEFIYEQNISEIDLMKINIEGGEYDLLPRLLDQQKISDIKYIQIQFHDIERDSKQKKDNIRNHLQNTHSCEYCYEFVWENWVRKDLI